MLFATSSHGKEYSGHIKDNDLTYILNGSYFNIAEIQADGDELVKCCEILGRQLPKKRVYTFLGNNAQEIAKNWDSN